MQLREMLNLKHVLNPVISQNAPKGSNAMDAFSDVLMKKNNASPLKEPFNNGVIQKNPPYVRSDVESSTEKKPKFSLEVKRKEMPDSSAIRTRETEKQNENVKNEKVQAKDQKSEPVKDQEGKASKDALTDEVKDKLVKKTNLSEEEIMNMLNQLNLDFNALTELLNGQGEMAELMNQLASILDTLDIEEALSQPIDTTVGTDLVNQLSQLVDKVEKLMMKANEMPETSQGKPFEASIVQALTKLIEELESMESDSKVSPTDVKAAVIEAVTQIQATKTETVDTHVKSMNAMSPSEVAPKISGESSMDAKQSGSEKGNTDAQHPQTMQSAVQTDTSQTPVVKAEVIKSDQEAIGLHQIIMKQGNSVATPNVQQAGSLKQEVFTQILDAIKGHMKLSDQGTSLLVKLQPEQLGNVELKLNIQKGIVLAEIKVENTMVKAAIESNLDDLKQSLSQKGYTIDQIHVNVDSGKKEQQHFDFNQNQSSHAKKQNVENEDYLKIDSKDQILGTGYQLDLYEESTINYYG